MDKKEEIFQYFPNFPLNTYPNKKYLMNVLNVRLCLFHLSYLPRRWNPIISFKRSRNCRILRKKKISLFPYPQDSTGISLITVPWIWKTKERLRLDIFCRLSTQTAQSATILWRTIIRESTLNAGFTRGISNVLMSTIKAETRNIYTFVHRSVLTRIKGTKNEEDRLHIDIIHEWIWIFQ